MIFDYNKLKPREFRLDNGISVYAFDDKKLDLVRLEFIFEAGSFFQNKRMTAQACCSLLTEGTSTWNAEEISDKLDYYGAYIEKDSDRDQSSIVIYCMSRYLKEIIPLCEDLIKRSIFPEKEIEIYKQKLHHKFLVSLQKVNEISRKAFYQMLFGPSHPYGQVLEEADFDHLNREDVLEFYQQAYVSENCNMVLSGSYDVDEITKVLNHSFGGRDWTGKARVLPCGELPWEKPLPEKRKIEKKDAVQTSVRMGKMVIGPKHPDFFDFKILDYVFGGYFGSRIMKNIREEKGYTYGISSYMVPLRYSTVWMIASEVKSSKGEAVIKEIQKEMKLLCEEEISEQELDLVRHSYTGEFLREMDGTFDISEKTKFHLMFGLDEHFYEQFDQRLRNITPYQIKETAKKYFDPNTLFCVVAG